MVDVFSYYNCLPCNFMCLLLCLDTTFDNHSSLIVNIKSLIFCSVMKQATSYLGHYGHRLLLDDVSLCLMPFAC